MWKGLAQGTRKRAARGAVLIFLGVQVLAAFHARSFLFFGPSGVRTSSIESIGWLEAASVLVMGPTLPRALDTTDPEHALGRAFSSATFEVEAGLSLEMWRIDPNAAPVGTVVLLHGYGGVRSELLPVASFFLERDWRVFLVNQRGAGSSGGAFTTLGHLEGQDAAHLLTAIREKLDGPLVVYGFSMGAAAAIRSVALGNAPVDAIIAEASYGSLVETVERRFLLLHLPPWPGAQLLTLWGSVWAGFNAFALRPVDDAPRVKVPTLVISGALDERAPVADGDAISARLGGPAERLVLANTGHQLGLASEPAQWQYAVEGFLARQLGILTTVRGSLPSTPSASASAHSTHEHEE